MADVLSSVRQWMAAQSSITALVGTRIYRGKLIQNATLPAVVVSKISGTHEHKLSTGLAGVAHSRIQVDVYGSISNPIIATTIAATIKDSGIMTLRGEYYSVFINSVELESGPSEFTDGEDPGTDDTRFIVSQDFMIHYSETGS